MDQKELYQNIRVIEFNSNKLANNLLAGAYRSAFKGKGMEFEEVRTYTPGDDIRSIDWNVTARMNEPYVKNFREERELSIMLLIDISASTRFGSRISKQKIIAEIGALLAFSARKNQDKVGLILFSDVIEEYLPPKHGLSHILRIVRDTLAFQPNRLKTNISHALNFLGKVQKKTCVAFLISDFMTSDFSQEAQLIARQHDLIAISVTDSSEYQIPVPALLNLKDLESEQELLIEGTSSTDLKERNREIKNLMHRVRGGFIELKTDQEYFLPIQQFFQRRSRK